MKKNFFAGLLSLALVACSTASTPENAVSNFLNHLQKGEFAAANQMVESGGIEFKDVKDSHIFEKMEYTILSKEVQQDRASVVVKIKSIALADVMMNSMDGMMDSMSDMDINMDDPAEGMKEALEQTRKGVSQGIQKAASTEGREDTLQVELVNKGGWKIRADNAPLALKLVGL
ncbi:hypothetical protein [Deinococcus roseus]|uniref:DUF4878 domain-containing protein n=1 Tax=Deinococcus roseus TaxID=392414 RepID=A0ABQ2CZR7_9DEIO|nr:hypothetical protein [Deinococcus roseus]GGJ37060.1 hypothetical protein GCM10008938_23890 [Deinococcus roseus]